MIYIQLTLIKNILKKVAIHSTDIIHHRQHQQWRQLVKVRRKPVDEEETDDSHEVKDETPIFPQG